MSSRDEAIAARDLLRKRLGHPEWLKGVGLAGKQGSFNVRVNVSRLTKAVRERLPTEIAGVPVSVSEVGNVVALKRRAAPRARAIRSDEK